MIYRQRPILLPSNWERYFWTAQRTCIHHIFQCLHVQIQIYLIYICSYKSGEGIPCSREVRWEEKGRSWACCGHQVSSCGFEINQQNSLKWPFPLKGLAQTGSLHRNQKPKSTVSKLGPSNGLGLHFPEFLWTGTSHSYGPKHCKGSGGRKLACERPLIQRMGILQDVESVLKDPLESTHPRTEKQKFPWCYLAQLLLANTSAPPGFLHPSQRLFLDSVVFLKPLTMLNTGDRLKAVLNIYCTGEMWAAFFHGGKKKTSVKSEKGRSWLPLKPGAAKRFPSPGWESFSKNPDGEATVPAFWLASWRICPEAATVRGQLCCWEQEIKRNTFFN